MADSEQTASSPKADSPKLHYIKDTRAKSVPQPLTGSQDLITTFNLLPLYNQYIKQKGENNEDLPPLEQTYQPFIGDLPGKNVIRPGNYIRALLEAPEKSYGPIHPFPSSTMRDSFSLRPGPVPGFDPSVLGTEEEYRQPSRNAAAAGDPTKSRILGYGDSASVPTNASPAQSSHSHHHHHSSHSHSHNHGHHSSKSSIPSPHVDKAEREGEGGREHKHKKKKKKRKHEHDHEHTHHEGEGDSEHRKKKKRKKEREDHGEYGEHGEIVVA